MATIHPNTPRVPSGTLFQMAHNPQLDTSLFTIGVPNLGLFNFNLIDTNGKSWDFSFLHQVGFDWNDKDRIKFANGWKSQVLKRYKLFMPTPRARRAAAAKNAVVSNPAAVNHATLPENSVVAGHKAVTVDGAAVINTVIISAHSNSFGSGENMGETSVQPDVTQSVIFQRPVQSMTSLQSTPSTSERVDEDHVSIDEKASRYLGEHDKHTGGEGSGPHGNNDGHLGEEHSRNSWLLSVLNPLYTSEQDASQYGYQPRSSPSTSGIGSRSSSTHETFLSNRKSENTSHVERQAQRSLPSVPGANPRKRRRVSSNFGMLSSPTPNISPGASVSSIAVLDLSLEPAVLNHPPRQNHTVKQRRTKKARATGSMSFGPGPAILTGTTVNTTRDPSLDPGLFHYAQLQNAGSDDIRNDQPQTIHSATRNQESPVPEQAGDQSEEEHGREQWIVNAPPTGFIPAMSYPSSPEHPDRSYWDQWKTISDNWEKLNEECGEPNVNEG